MCDHQVGELTDWMIFLYADAIVDSEVGGVSFSEMYTCLARAPATLALYTSGSAYAGQQNRLTAKSALNSLASRGAHSLDAVGKAGARGLSRVAAHSAHGLLGLGAEQLTEEHGSNGV